MKWSSENASKAIVDRVFNVFTYKVKKFALISDPYLILFYFSAMTLLTPGLLVGCWILQ